MVVAESERDWKDWRMETGKLLLSMVLLLQIVYTLCKARFVSVYFDERVAYLLLQAREIMQKRR